ncbi:MAG: ATP-dependent metallopeptidase FtsH/Yme1/Tma family protein, partial [Bryobacteraceae bacterium]|nr:ATP-dependent metallopeptidase FtsH/Yme1/Tma family protein [Bryobacteraceae bacterium]
MICVIVILVVAFQQGRTHGSQAISFTEFLNRVEAGRVKSVVITGTEVRGEYRDQPSGLRTVIPANYPDIYNLLRDKGVDVDIKEPSGGSWVSIFVNIIPFALMIGIWVFLMRQMQSGGNKALSFGKSRARLHSSHKKVTFKDVAGVDEAKEELQEIIEFLREPQKFQKLGGRIPKGVLLIGPPGTGKTLLAR